jgi:hypothetical protein
VQGLQDQVYEDFKINCTRTLIFSFQSNETNVLEHIAPIYFPIYSVVIVLYACVKDAHLCQGLLELAYPSLKPQSCWVVIIGLELLSLS